MVAAARAATQILVGQSFESSQVINVPNQKEPLSVNVISASSISNGKQALAISHVVSDLGLDLTNGLELWVLVQWQDPSPTISDQDIFVSDFKIQLSPGVGVGKFLSSGQLCISNFAKDLLKINLEKLIPEDRALRVEIIIPKGVELSERTSNKSFGVVDGLALIGTQANVQESASPNQLSNCIHELKSKCSQNDFGGELVLVIGENGLNLAKELGLPPNVIVKSGNWIGPLLVAAAESGVHKLLLLGYHGKLVKLAGGIFHTHHHLADGRLEVLIAIAVKVGLPMSLIEVLVQVDSVEKAFLALEAKDSELAEELWLKIAILVEVRSAAYLRRYGNWPMEIGAALFDRKRCLRWKGSCGSEHLSFFGIKC